MAACSHLLVRYPAHSLSKIGRFCGGDCVVSLSRIALSVTQPDDTPIATWHYSTIRSFEYRSSLFCFVSGRRGPYGEKTYFFKVTFSVMSSLLSVLSELLNMQIEYIADSEGCNIESNDCSKKEVAARVPYSKKAVQNSETSSCYKVAKSTFYTDLPSETRKMDNAPSSSRVHHLASRSPPPSLSIPIRKENNMCKAPERHFASSVTPQNLSTSVLVAKPSKPHQSLPVCKSEGDSGTDSSYYIKSLSSPAPTRRAQMPCNKEYLQLQSAHQPQMVHQSTTFPSLFINYESDPGEECIDHVGGDEEGKRGARDDAMRVHTAMANRVRHMSLDDIHNDSSMECCLPLPFSTLELTLNESTDDDDCIERQDEDIVKQSSHQPHYENPVASSIDIANESLVLSEESTTGDSDTQCLENWALPCNGYFSKHSLLDERAAVGVVHHVIRPCSSVEYSNVCMHVKLSTEID